MDFRRDFHCRPKPGNQAEGVRGSYYPDLHFIHVELEDLHASWNQKVPGYFGFGYAELGVGVCYLSVSAVVINLEANSRTPHAGCFCQATDLHPVRSKALSNNLSHS